jgi:hypothetical protein
MTPIGVAIAHVVEEIPGAGECAEDRERQRRGDGGRRVEKASAEDKSGEEQQVLGPLPWTQ